MSSLLGSSSGLASPPPKATTPSAPTAQTAFRQTEKRVFYS
jgi:hypothetical protein